ncbi:alkbh6 [Symbiodinium sp. CCMP2456]|nr:alkbh6 [Symbiodinium sp. CCMP2456]
MGRWWRWSWTCTSTLQLLQSFRRSHTASAVSSSSTAWLVGRSRGTGMPARARRLHGSSVVSMLRQTPWCCCGSFSTSSCQSQALPRTGIRPWKPWTRSQASGQQLREHLLPRSCWHPTRLAQYQRSTISLSGSRRRKRRSSFRSLMGTCDMRTRSSQEWGAGDRCTCGRGLMRMPLPESQQKLADALHQLGVFDAALYPMNSIRINGYRPGQGIHPHCDGPVYYPKESPSRLEVDRDTIRPCAALTFSTVMS